MALFKYVFILMMTANAAFAVSPLDYIKRLAGGTPAEDSVNLAGNVILTVSSNEKKGAYEVFLSTTSEPTKKLFLEFDSIKAITQFENQSVGLDGDLKHVEVKDANNKNVGATNWFAIQTNDKILLFFKNKSVDAFSIPNTSDSLLDISFSTLKVTEGKNQKFYYLFSLRDIRGQEKTYIIDVSNSHIWPVSEKFFKNAQGMYITDADGSVKLGEHTYSIRETLGRPPYGLPKMDSSHTGVGNGLRNKDGSLANGASGTFASSNGAKPDGTPDTESPPEENVENRNEHPPVPHLPVDVTLEHKGEKYKIVSGNDVDSGIFVKRLSDGVTVKMSFQATVPQISGAQKGFTIRNGILSHPNLVRKIDLDKSAEGVDIFKVYESNFIPQSFSDSGDDPMENKQAIEFSKGFRDFRKMSEKLLHSPEKRLPKIDEIVSEIAAGETVAKMLIGESTDKDLIMGDIAKRLPRTWNLISFETGPFGEIKMSGEVNRKTNLLRSAMRMVPTVLFTKNFLSFSGFGSAGESKTDVLEILGDDFSDKDGYLKMVGTASSFESIRNRIKNAEIVTNLSRSAISDLSAAELKSYLNRYLKVTFPEVVIDDTSLEYLLNKTSTLRKVNPEPKRSEDFIRAIARKIKKGDIEMPEIDRATTYALDVSENLATEERQLDTLSRFSNKVGDVLIGHGHIVKKIQRKLEIGLAGLHQPRGAMTMEWIEGPPGVGKTELAKAIAKSLNVPLGYIDMNNYKDAQANPNDLLAAIAKQVSKNPHSTILLDEVEKANPKVLEALLRALSSSEFTYVEDGVEIKETLYNNNLILTANTVGDLVLEWFLEKIAADPKYDTMTSEELDVEFKKHLAENKLDLKEMLTQPSNKLPNGLPAPLIDRVRVHVAYPPGFSALVAILNLKLKELKTGAEKSLGIEITIKSGSLSEKDVVETYVKRARAQRMSVRDIIDNFEEETNATIAKIRRSKAAVYRTVRYYEVDPLNYKYIEANTPIHQCMRMYSK